MMVNGSATIRVCAVVVSYYPEVCMLRKVFKALSSQVSAILLVDNTPDEHPEINNVAQEFCTKSLSFGKNHGIAHGHNCGIRWARERGFSHVLLMDQDSVPRSNMVEELVKAQAELVATGIYVAALGPSVSDEKYGGPSPFIVREGWRIRKIYCAENDKEPFLVEYIISSGSLVAIEVLDKIGEMDESLFIDYVDIEWGLRARSKGFSCFGVCPAVMDHCLADYSLPMPFSMGRRVPVRTPLRHYYQFRNAIRVYRRTYVPLAWVINDAYRLILKYFYYALVTPPRWQHLKMMTLGLWHGVLDRGGSLSSHT